MTDDPKQIVRNLIKSLLTEAKSPVADNPVIVPPTLYDNAVAAGVIQADDPRWRRGTLLFQ